MKAQPNDTQSHSIESRHAFDAADSAPPYSETEEMHQTALADIRARGQKPEIILRAFDLMDKRLREKHGLAPKAEPLATDEDQSPWSISHATYFEESVAAGFPTPGQESDGREAELGDLMQGVNPKGKLLVKVSGTSMTGTSIQHGDTVLVDPKAEIRDGDLVLANVAGHGQLVKRLRISADGEATLESENPDFKPIKVKESADLRIHGKVVWRCGPLR